MNEQHTDNRKLITRLFFRLLPMQILLAVIGSVNGIISSLFAGNYIGEEAMSAVGLYGPFNMFIGAVSAMFIGGALLLCGQYMGGNQTEETQGIFSLDIVVTVAAGALFTLLLAAAAGFDLLGFMAKDPAVRHTLNQYVYGQAIGVIPYMLGQHLSAFLSLENRTRLAVAASLIYIAANVVFNFVFLGIFNSGVFGLGLASSLGLWVYLLIQLVHYFGKNALFRIRVGSIRLRDTLQIIKVGAPGALTNGWQTLRGYIVNALILGFVGAAGISAFTAANSFLSLFWTIPTGMLAVSRMLFSVSAGEEDRRTLTDIMRIALFRCIPIMFAVSVLIIICAVPLTRLYYRDPSAPVYMMTVWCFRILPLCMPLSIVSMHFVCYGQISGKQLLVYLITALDGWICVSAFSALLIRSMGLNAVCVANVLNGIVIILVVIAYSWIKKKHFPANMDDLMVIPDDFGVPDDARLDLSVRNTAEVTEVAAGVQDFCLKAGIDERRSHLAALFMEEMAGNVIEHGFTKDRRKDHTIDIRVVHKNDDIILRIKDDCVPFDPAERSKILDPDDITKNIGIRMVYAIADDIRYQNILGLNVQTIRA